jgi:hypothetical protein
MRHPRRAALVRHRQAAPDRSRGPAGGNKVLFDDDGQLVEVKPVKADEQKADDKKADDKKTDTKK